jgi:hypothetical protein
MPIPALNDDGFLPEGLHDCSLSEIQLRFGQFQRTDRRCRLFERLEVFLRAVKSTGLVTAAILDGSFVTDKDSPNDIDLILVLKADHDFAASLRPFEYNALSKRHVRRHFGFDVLLARDGSEALNEHLVFFAGIRGNEDFRKGLLRVFL